MLAKHAILNPLVNWIDCGLREIGIKYEIGVFSECWMMGAMGAQMPGVGDVERCLVSRAPRVSALFRPKLRVT